MKFNYQIKIKWSNLVTLFLYKFKYKIYNK